MLCSVAVSVIANYNGRNSSFPIKLFLITPPQQSFTNPSHLFYAVNYTFALICLMLYSIFFTTQTKLKEGTTSKK